MSGMKLREINQIGRENHWDCDRHTIHILQGLLADEKYRTPGEIFALRRAIRIVRHAKARHSGKAPKERANHAS